MDWCDPGKVLEIQASYLRFLASVYSSKESLTENKSPPVKDASPEQIYKPETNQPSQEPRPKNPFDDVPVKQVQKTFEQLLEEKLQTEKTPDSVKNRTESAPKFLKRGEGQLCSRQVSLSVKNSPQKKTSHSRNSSNDFKTDKFTPNKSEHEKLLRLARQLELKKRKLEEREKDLSEKKELTDFSKDKEILKLQSNLKNLKESQAALESKHKQAIQKLKNKIQTLKHENSHLTNKPKTTAKETQTEPPNLNQETFSTQLYNKTQNKPTKLPEPAVFLEPPKPKLRKNRSSSLNTSPSKCKTQIVTQDGKVQKLYEDGRKEVVFKNGIRREVYPNGYSVVYFSNNDIKQIFPDGKTIYYFSASQTIQTTFPDGLKVLKFSNGQVEKHHSDKSKEIQFPDGTTKCIFANGEEETIFSDGTTQKLETNGTVHVTYPNGTKDTILPSGKRVKRV
mmetsp:Transcript_10069/g.15044  ORF Transcript_10069/g.15044 Transcript_10069/m.15044 type:complete len:450 (+) Transcript_10069:40-1389(+)